jgi:hypothetical protein
MILVKSVSPQQFDLSIPGNVAINFLRAIKENPSLAESDEALEFVNILSEPFREYSDLEFRRMNTKFAREITEAEAVEVEKLIKSHEGRDAHRDRARAMAERDLERIGALARQGHTAGLRRELITFILRHSSPTYPDIHLPIFEMIEKLDTKKGSHKKEILDAAAVVIYHEILKAIASGRLGRAVTLIGKYAVIFRGDPKAAYYSEVDSFEKKFYALIEERNLWEKI